MNEIQKRSFDDFSADESNFLQSLLEKALNASFLNEDEFLKITNELKAFLIYSISAYPSSGVSTLSSSKAELIVKTSIYLIELAIKNLPLSKALEEVKTLNFKDLYDDGLKKANELYSKTFLDISKIKANTFKSNNVMFLDAVQSNLVSFISNTERFEDGSICPTFFVSCSDDFDFSYNLAGFKEKGAGIEKVQNYVSCLKLENDFLCRLNPDTVNALSEEKKPSDFSQELDDNIFSDEYVFNTENIFLPALKHVLNSTLKTMSIGAAGQKEKYLLALNALNSSYEFEEDLKEYCTKAIDQLIGG